MGDDDSTIPSPNIGDDAVAAAAIPSPNIGDDAAAAIPIPDRRRGSSILLSLKPHFTDSRNDTTAVAESEDGNTMAVTLWVADPPQLSLFSVSCTKSDTEPCYFSVTPHVVGADGPFVLIRAVLRSGYRREYFLYKAANPLSSLDTIPCPGDDDLGGVKELGIVGLGGHSYLLAALRHAPSAADGYQLRIYSSEARSWSTRTLPNPCPGIGRVVPDKVITLGTPGVLGWVDLSQGILVCDLSLLPPLQHQHQEDISAAGFYFIPLPDRLPGNKYKLKYPIPPAKKIKNEHHLVEEPAPSSSWFRDLTCVDGVLKFVEMENPLPQNKEDNVMYPSDLIMSLKRKSVDENPKHQLSCFRDDWRAVTWTWNLGSSCWRQTHAAHVADIKEEGQQLRAWYSAFPILSPDDDDGILYLRSLLEPSDREGSLVALDIPNKSLKAIGKYYIPQDFYYHSAHDPDHPFRACTLSRHLDMTAPGIQVSEYRKTTQASRSCADHPSETSTPMTYSERRHALRTLTGLATNIQRAQSNSSRVHPAQNKLPLLQCFNKLDYTRGNSAWANQNNLAPQQCVNFIKPDGPGYASLAPVHGRHNYQPVWPPSKQQLTSSSEFGPHEAPQPCFNSYHGGSYPGYSQQLYAPNSFAYGAHTGYRQQLPPSPELPIGASWQPPPPGVEHQPTPRE